MTLNADDVEYVRNNMTEELLPKQVNFFVRGGLHYVIQGTCTKRAAEKYCQGRQIFFATAEKPWLIN